MGHLHRVRRTEATIQKRRDRHFFHAPKLTEDQKIQVCHWIAQFLRNYEIMRKVKEQGWTVEFNLRALNYYRTDAHWQPIIDRFRQEWVAGVVKVAIAHKRTRLEKLTALLERTEQETSKRLEGRLKLVRTQLSIIEQARLEMDEKDTNITNYYLTQYNEFTDAQLLARREELLAKIQRWRLPNAVGHGCQDAQEAGSGESEVDGESGPGGADPPRVGPCAPGPERELDGPDADRPGAESAGSGSGSTVGE